MLLLKSYIPGRLLTIQFIQNQYYFIFCFVGSQEMSKEFQIPTKICLEAKQFMKLLLQHLKDNRIMITGLDHGGLTLIAWTYHTWVQATEILSDESFIIEETNARNTTITKIHPAIKIQYDAAAQLRQLLVEYGLTPKSRGRVDALQGDLFEVPPQLSKFKIV